MNWIKLGVIIAVIFVFVASVLVFLKTRVSPPQELEFANQHLLSLQQDTDRLSGNIGIAKADSLLFTTIDAAVLFAQEKLVSIEDANRIIKLTAEKYVPFYADEYKTFFAGNDWNESHIKELRFKSKFLLNLKSFGNKEFVLADNLKQKVDSANIILDKYDKARHLCKSTSYTSLKESERIIKEAMSFCNMKPLSNCTALVKQLSGLREKLEYSHYRKISNMVRKLNDYRSFSKDDFMNNQVPKVTAAIKEYKDGALRVYGTSHCMQQLEKDAANAYNNAEDYYTNML